MRINQFIKNTKRVFPEQGRYEYLRYDMNENPEGLPKDFVDSVLKEITPQFLSIYPEPDKFIEKYAKFVGATPENVTTTNGSDMAIRYIFETFGEVGKKVVTVSPTFGMYGVNCSILGYNHIAVPYNDDLSIDVQKIVDAIDEDTRIVSLLNPNNPIGDAFTTDELAKITAKADAVDAVVFIDEAYHYFYDKTFIDFALTRNNVILSRTFSKLFSIAACRLGVIISSPQIIRYIKNSKLTFDTNSIALLFGQRIIENTQLVDTLIKTERDGKNFLIEELTKQGYECIACKANFVLVKPNHTPDFVERELKEKAKILIHTFGDGILKNYIRISTGSVKSMQVFLDAFLKIDLPSQEVQNDRK